MKYRLGLVLLYVLVLLGVQGQGSCDGCFVWRNRGIDILQPSQKAIIEWDGKTENLTIQTKYKGPVDELVWIVPVPAEPEVKKADLEAFEEASKLTQSAPFIYTVFPAEAAITLRSAAAPSPLVARRQVGIYDVAILAPNMDGAVLRWLRDNDFPVADTAAKVIADYDSRNWHIIASRIAPDMLTESVQEHLAEGTLHPLCVSFAADRCVYPMRMTSLARGPVEVLLWIKAEHHYQPETLAGTEWEITLHGGPSMSLTSWGEVWQPHTRNTRQPAQCITKLRRTFDPKTITEDLYLKEIDYTGFFNPADERNVGMTASQLGMLQDTRAIPLLSDYLTQTKLEGKPHIRSVVWALGECSAGGKMPVVAEDLLARVAKDDPTDLGLECCVALEKAGYRKLGPIILARMTRLMETAALGSSWPEAFDSRATCLLLADWLHKNADSIQREYAGILAKQIQTLSDQIGERRNDTRRVDILDEYGTWLVAEAARAQDRGLIASLNDLRDTILTVTGNVDSRTVAADATSVLMALVACHDQESRDALLQWMEEETGELEKKFEDTEPNDLKDMHRSDAMFAFLSDSFAGSLLFHVSPFDTKTEIGAKFLPGPARQQIAASMLDRSAMGDYCTLYFLGWLTKPERAHVSRLKALWSVAAKQTSEPTVIANLALKVGEFWRDADLIKWMLQDTPQLETKERCLIALLRLDPDIAATALGNIVPMWNEKYSSLNIYHYPTSAEVPRFDMELQEEFLRAISAGLDSGEFNKQYEYLCSDKQLHPAARYHMLDLLGFMNKEKHPWSAALAEALFDEAAPGASQEDYKGLVRLLAHSDCVTKLASEWETTEEYWKKEELTRLLLVGSSSEGSEVLDKMLRQVWYKQYGDIDDGAYDAFFKKMGADLEFVRNACRDVVERVVRDDSFPAGYRACLACAVPVLDIEEMKELAEQGLPESIHASMLSVISEMEKWQSETGTLR